jgi:hypothetical protein
MVQNLKIGDEVSTHWQVTASIHVVHEFKPYQESRYVRRYTSNVIATTRGIFLGWNYLYDGLITKTDEGRTFTPQKTWKVAMIQPFTDDKQRYRRPIAVLAEDLQ